MAREKIEYTNILLSWNEHELEHEIRDFCYLFVMYIGKICASDNSGGGDTEAPLECHTRSESGKLRGCQISFMQQATGQCGETHRQTS